MEKMSVFVVMSKNHVFGVFSTIELARHEEREMRKFGYRCDIIVADMNEPFSNQIKQSGDVKSYELRSKISSSVDRS